MRWVFAIAAVSAAFAARVEPVALSASPFTGQRGSTFVVTVRGNGLKQAKSVYTGGTPFKAAVESAETETSGRNKADLVRVKLESPADAKPGRYHIRMITPGGVSNALTIVLTGEPVLAEPDGPHESPATAIPVSALPTVFTGRIPVRGESDMYAFDAKAGETITFEALSGLPAPGAAGGNARGFDPALGVYEQSGSWFDPKRLNRVAFNDEPLWATGRPTDAHLVHRFAKAGRYFLRVEAFSGQGGPDYSYQLSVRSGSHPPDQERPEKDWEERGYSRRLSSNRMNELAERGGKSEKQKIAETFRATASGEPATVTLPANIDGAIAAPGESHRARFRLDGPQDIAIEVETPSTAPPLFNPIVRLLDSRNEEVATNISVGRGACTGAMFKSIAPKVIIPIRDPGEYTVEIRETTADLASPDFKYRVQVRPQVPHLGDVKADQDHVNLEPGDATTMRVTFDREEDYRGAVAVSVEGLPPGVTALAGADFEPDKDPPPTKGKRERYTPRTERSVVVFTASGEAPAVSTPVIARVTVRPVVDGKPGAVVGSKSVPVMVVRP